MGKHFGNLQRLKGVIYYSLSPSEIHPFKGFFNPGIINAIRLFSKDIITIIPGAVFTFAIFNKAYEIEEKEGKKNPEDYKDEK